MFKENLIYFSLFLNVFANQYIWTATGSGLKPEVNVPVRTFFVKISNQNGSQIDAKTIEPGNWPKLGSV